MNTKPIKPEQVTQTIPDGVFAVFNSLIAKNIVGNTSIIYASELVDNIMSQLNIPKEDIYRLKYLDVEDFYRDVGWKVEYEAGNWREPLDKPFFRFNK